MSEKAPQATFSNEPRNLSDLPFPLLRSCQKPRFLPAEAQLMSEKAPQATFSNELGCGQLLVQPEQPPVALIAARRNASTGHRRPHRTAGFLQMAAIVEAAFDTP